MDCNFGDGFLTGPQLFFGTTLLVGRVTGISGNGSFRGLPFRSLQFSSITIPDHCRSGRSVQLSRTIFQTFAQRFFDNSNVATMLSLDYLSVCFFSKCLFGYECTLCRFSTARDRFFLVNIIFTHIYNIDGKSSSQHRCFVLCVLAN